EPLTSTWHWQVGDTATFIGEQQLAPETARDCDRVRCWVTVTDGHVIVSSEAAETVLRFGAQCDDENVCTDDTCAPGGGCAHADNTADCSDANPCNGVEVCAE